MNQNEIPRDLDRFLDWLKAQTGTAWAKHETTPLEEFLAAGITFQTANSDIQGADIKATPFWGELMLMD
ncbi:MAG: hypothetical protein OER56_05075 [Hyphomicrobiales bacterium]|nr:hypothetical protein [Hyphomicrobiales bacterium]